MRVGFLRVVFLLSVFSFACLWASESALAAKDDSKYYQLHIPEQVVEEALQSLAKQVGKQLLFSHQSVDSLKSNAIKGRYTLPQALTQLLEGTGLSADQTDSGVIVITSANRNDYFGLGDDGMNSKKKMLASLVSFFVGSSGAVGVLAQEGVAEDDTKSWTMEEIVVTAQKREQRLIDVPIAISVVGEETLKNAGIESISDLSYLVPNLSVLEREGGDQTYTIRGVGNSGGNTAAPLVGVYLDDIPLSFGNDLAVDLQAIDIALVEVLKGPQGTLYGAGSVGGTIRYVSNRPSFNGIEGSIGASFADTTGGDTSSEIAAIVNVPVLDDTFAFRVAATYKDRGGWIDKINEPGGEEDFNGNELSHIRLRGLWQVSDNFTSDFAMVRHRNDAGGPYSTNIGDVSDSNYRAVERHGNSLPLADPSSSNNYNLYSLAPAK